jgi:hypothetical protein
MTTTHANDIDHLNSLLRGELSAVETYDQVLDKLTDEPSISVDLRACRSSHQGRVYALRSEVVRLGGEPAEGSGAWGTFAKLVEGGAKLFGTKSAIAALEEGEDHGLKEYEEERGHLSDPVRAFVEREIAPEQKRTHHALARLKERL